MHALSPVIAVDPEKCTNCHACIGACPVKFCNDASGDHVSVNSDLCIGCGECIDRCSHDARSGVDDLERWLKAVRNGTPMVAISAPAVAANFPGQFLNLHGWLQSLGVKAFFDVSFGAELTVRSYLNHIAKNSPATVIAQPCPAIVSYIQLYQPELIPHLAPADSPMMHTIKMIRTYYPEYRDHPVLILSPCLAKRREFDAVGLGDFNVTYKSLARHIKQTGINLAAYPSVDFVGSDAERAVLFSSPGGLQRTVARENPAVAARARKIEGPHVMYKYLKQLPGVIKKGIAPPLIDCLSCEMGCNGGPGTMNRESAPDEIEEYVEERNRAAQGRTPVSRAKAQALLKTSVRKHWSAELYSRSYQDLSGNNTIAIPDNSEREAIYRRLHKSRPRDFLNCDACGYGRCEDMAVAIHNNLNTPQNCFHYERTSRTEMTEMLFERIRSSTGHLTVVLNSITTDNGDTPAGEHDRVVSMTDIAEISRKIRTSIQDGLGFIDSTISTMGSIDTSNRATTEQMQALEEQIRSISEIAGMISAIADQTKIIAFNAELEASSAGANGRNFEIVASEIRRLANSTVASTETIKEKIQQIQSSSHLLATSAREERSSIRKGSEMAEHLRTTFDRIGTFAGESDRKIADSIEHQIATFQQTIDELKDIVSSLDRFHAGS